MTRLLSQVLALASPPSLVSSSDNSNVEGGVKEVFCVLVSTVAAEDVEEAVDGLCIRNFNMFSNEFNPCIPNLLAAAETTRSGVHLM